LWNHIELICGENPSISSLSLLKTGKVCFDMRMEQSALYAHERGFDDIATTNSTSWWKDAQ